MSMEPLSGDDPVQVASYQLRARLGAGGMGRVYLAYTPGGRPVALKVVRPEFDADPTFRERFRHEVDAARRVHGLYTAQVLDADPAATPPWLVTAYVPGPSLQQALAQYGPMPPDTVFQLMAGVAEALEAIHGAGVVHRDLKPSNVILAPDGPRVIDFGIARAADASTITQQGVRVGSPQFMAPEQILGRPPTPAVDVFALGHLAAFAVLGRSPFGDGDAAAVFARILNQPPDLTGCPQPLRALIERCLSKDPEARPAPGGVVAACREHQNPQTVQIAEAWLPPAMAAALAQHTAPPPPMQYAAQPLPAQPVPTVQAPPPTYPYPVGATSQSPTGVFIPRTTMMRAAVGVVVIGAVIGLGIVFLHGTDKNNAGLGAPPHSSSASATAASGPQSPAAGAGSASPSLAAGLDPCLVGTWRGVSGSQFNDILGEPTEFNGPGPDSVTLKPNGTGSTDYGTGVTYTANVPGESLTEVVVGSDSYDYQTTGGTVVFTDIQANGTETLYLNGVADGSTALSPLTSDQYTCSGNTLRVFQSSGQSSTELARAS